MSIEGSRGRCRRGYGSGDSFGKRRHGSWGWCGRVGSAPHSKASRVGTDFRVRGARVPDAHCASLRRRPLLGLELRDSFGKRRHGL
jgi:hypothetical protein